MQFKNVQTFDQWRQTARRLISAQVSPAEVQWTDDAAQPSLFESPDVPQGEEASFTVPKAFIEVAMNVACRDRLPCV